MNSCNRKLKKKFHQPERISLKDCLPRKNNRMKTDYRKHFLSLSLIFILIWTLSCSGRSGNTKETVVHQAPSASEELSLKLIKLISPEENTGFKLNQPLKVTLALEDKK
jgi:hypothetical protein